MYLSFSSVNAVLVIMPRNVNVENKLRMFHAVDECIPFTVEQETENILPSLDTVVHRVGNIAYKNGEKGEEAGGSLHTLPPPSSPSLSCSAAKLMLMDQSALPWQTSHSLSEEDILSKCLSNEYPWPSPSFSLPSLHSYVLLLLNTPAILCFHSVSSLSIHWKSTCRNERWHSQQMRASD